MATNFLLRALTLPATALLGSVASVSGFATIALTASVAETASAQEPPRNFVVMSPIKGNAFASPGLIQMQWDHPLGASEDLKFYEFVREDLRTGEFASWTIPFTPAGVTFCDQVNRDPTLVITGTRTFQFGCYKPPAPPPPDLPYPWPYRDGLGPNYGVTPDGDLDPTTPGVPLGELVPPGAPNAAPTGPSPTPWSPTLQATAYRYYMRAIYDTNETPPAARFEGSTWVSDDGWRQVVVDVPSPLGPVLTPFDEVPVSDLYVTDSRRPFQQPVPPNPAYEQYSDINVPFGDETFGCPIVGVRLQWKVGATTSGASTDACVAGPWPIAGTPGHSDNAIVVATTLTGTNVPPGMNTPGVLGGSVLLVATQGSRELTILTPGVFLRNGDALDVDAGSPLDAALGGGGNGTYFVSVLENDFTGPLGATSKVALSVSQADAVDFNRNEFLPANTNVAGAAALPFVGDAVAIAGNVIELPPGMYLEQGEALEVIASSNAALIGPKFAIRYQGTAAARTTRPVRQIQIATSAANAQALTAQAVAAGTTLKIRLNGAGLPVRYRLKRAYVAANATAVDLPPPQSSQFLVYESPEILNPFWLGLGTFQSLPNSSDWTADRDIIFDDTFAMPNPNPPVCQFAYWYGITRFVSLDSEGLYEVETADATVLVDPTTGDEILPIGAYACNDVGLDATGELGAAPVADTCATPSFCIPAGTTDSLGDRIRVTWDVAAQTFYSQFRLYRGICPDDNPDSYELQGPFVVLPGTTNVYSDFATAPNTRYWYRVEAFTPLSGWTQITPPETGFRLTPPKVNSATDGTLVGQVTGSVSPPTDWEPGSLRLWRRVMSVNPVEWVQLPAETITGNTFTDTTVQVGLVYAYAATAHSDELDADSIRGTVNQGYAAVTAPTNLTATSNLPEYVKLTWNTPVAAGAPVSYQVFRRKAGSSRFIQIGSTTSLAYFDATAVPNIDYQYRIRIRLSNGALSPNSTTVTGRRILNPNIP